MSWFLRGVQSAVFHYASCAPCTGYTDTRKRRRDAKRARKVREKLLLDEPDAYHHPEPTGTNPYWHEEIALGPGPPPRRARRTNTGSTRGPAPTGPLSTAASHGGSSSDGDDTMDSDAWNRKRYQREDEELWGLDDAPVPVRHTPSASSSSGLGSVLAYKTSRPGTSRSGSYYSARAPPVNDLHPPVVSLPSSDAADNRWMLQPPPRASVMAGKERATHRSRSGSGASSRVELSLQRHLSTRQLMLRLEPRHTQDLPPLAPDPPRNRSRTPSLPTRRDAALHRTDTLAAALNRTDTLAAALHRTDTLASRTDTLASHSSTRTGRTTPTKTGRTTPTRTGRTTPTVSVRQNRPALSTVVSSGSGANASPDGLHTTDENAVPQRPEQAHYRDATRSSDSLPAPRMAPLNSDLSSRMPPLNSDLSSPMPPLNSDLSSLNCLQDTVSPRALLNSRFISAPLVEAKIRLPPSNGHLSATARDEWNGNGSTLSRGWTDSKDQDPPRAPFDSRGAVHRDPKLRWSVDF